MRKAGFILSMALVLFFGSCKDDPIKPAPVQAVPWELRFVLNGIPASEPASEPIIALVSVEDANLAEVVSNAKLSVAKVNGNYVSEKIELESGEYKLTKFLVINSDGSARFASPRINSEKAPLVQKPLYHPIELAGPPKIDHTVEVVKISEQDKAESFGYPAGSFGQLNSESFIKIKLQAVVSIGDIVYDSIPADFRITSWTATGEKFEKDTVLSAGAKEVYLNATHARFSFQLQKWGLTDEMTLMRDQVTEGTRYTLGGAKAPKKLQREETFTLINGVYKADSKAIYSYSAGGDIAVIEYYQKMPQYAELQLVNKDFYYYESGNVVKIERFEGDGDKVGFTEFTYNPQGTKITNILQKSYDQQTGAAVEYSFPPGQAQILIDYLYSNGNSMQYKIRIVGGNKVEDAAVSSRGGGESGRYKYDFNINPYAHMKMPNIFLSNLSRNNMTDQVKSYSGSIPSAEPGNFQYSYDNDGYPTQVIKQYRSYQTKELLFTTKTIYTY